MDFSSDVGQELLKAQVWETATIWLNAGLVGAATRVALYRWSAIAGMSKFLRLVVLITLYKHTFTASKESERAISLLRHVLLWFVTDGPASVVKERIAQEFSYLLQYVFVWCMCWTPLSTVLLLIKVEGYILIFAVSIVGLWFLQGSKSDAVLGSAGIVGCLLPSLVFAVPSLSGALLYWLCSKASFHLGTAVQYLWRPYIQNQPNLGTYPIHQYKPLIGHREIRLLRIKQRVGRTLRCELEHCNLDQCQSAYDAISYCWGDPKPDHVVLIGEARLPITKNAFLVIQDRASLFEDRLIWIDRLCINQDDKDEKQSQIAMMRDIYANANRTICWVGDSMDGKLVEASVQDLTRRNLVMPQRGQSEGYVMPSPYEGRDKKTLALARFLSQPYFFRVWMIQEITASPAVHLRYGNTWLDWDTVAALCWTARDPTRYTLAEFRTISELGGHEDRGVGTNQICRLSRFRHEFQSGKPESLVDLLSQTMAFKSTEAVDQIFALVGISAQAQDDRIYERLGGSMEDVFVNTTKILLEGHGGIGILHLAGVGFNKDEKASKLPSWVPDYSNRHASATFRRYTSKRTYHAALDSTPTLTYHPPTSTLSIQCILLFPIKALTSVPASTYSRAKGTFDNSDMLDLHRFFQEVTTLSSSLPDPYLTGQPTYEATWRTLCGDTIHPSAAYIEDVLRPAPAEMALGYQWNCTTIDTMKRAHASGKTKPEDLAPFVAEELQGVQPGDLDHARRCVRLAYDFMVCGFSMAAVGRKFATTGEGYMALVPPGAREGDVVGVVMGAETPFLVRRVEGEGREGEAEGKAEGEAEGEGEYQLVGDCYVHGLMDGEGMGMGVEPGMIVLR